jgi:hypothetical protein
MYIGLRVNYPYPCRILILIEFFNGFSESTSNTKFRENPFSGSRVVPSGLTDGHNDANSSFLQFCESALKGTYCCV